MSEVPNKHTNGWDQWSNLVLHRLEENSEKIDYLIELMRGRDREVGNIKTKLTNVDTRLKRLEYFVYGAIMLVLTAVGASALGLLNLGL